MQGIYCERQGYTIELKKHSSRIFKLVCDIFKDRLHSAKQLIDNDQVWLIPLLIYAW